MIKEWLTTAERRAFLEGYLGQQPFSRAGTAHASTQLLDWATLDRVLGGGRSVDVLTVAAGHLIDLPEPRSSEDVRALMARGVSTVIRSSELHDEGLGRLAQTFSAELPGQVRVQLYVTPGGTHSFGWHYDLEDVFVVQTMGIKDYYFRDNTVARHTRLGERLDFACVRHEKSPRMRARLIAGDWLYLPRHWWHLVRCVEDSLSVSVGIMLPRKCTAAN